MELDPEDPRNMVLPYRVASLDRIVHIPPAAMVYASEAIGAARKGSEALYQLGRADDSPLRYPHVLEAAQRLVGQAGPQLEEYLVLQTADSVIRDKYPAFFGRKEVSEALRELESRLD